MGLALISANIAASDCRERVVPDIDLAAIGLAGLAVLSLSSASEPLNGWLDDLAPSPVVDAVIAAVVLCGSLMLIASVFRTATGRDGLGMGDVKLLGAWCFWLPLMSIVHAITGSAVLALAAIFVQRGRRGAAAEPHFPFAAILAPALWAVWLVMEYSRR